MGAWGPIPPWCSRMIKPLKTISAGKQWAGSAYQLSVQKKTVSSWVLHPEPKLVPEKGTAAPRGIKHVQMSCSLAVKEQITYGIIQACNEATFSFTYLWIKWFAETSVVCWGLNLPSLSLSVRLSLSTPAPPLFQNGLYFGCVS